MRRIGVLTSGGDAPGMNAAIRAVTRCALERGWEVEGIRHGFTGLIEGEFTAHTDRSVGGIIQRGGTILGSARCPAFLTEAGRGAAIAQLEAHRIDGLVVIGGNGSQCGAFELARRGVPVVGVASTIDNDLSGTDLAIGVDSALNIALEAIDRLKTTASSHHRAFLIEVMGRECGYLALMAGLAGGAEVVLIPEVEASPEEVATRMREAYERGKAHAIAVVAEGARLGTAALVKHFHEHHAQIGFELRTTTLGHVQRGGAPLAFDRLLATRLGAGAVAAFADGTASVLVGTLSGHVARTPLADVVGRKRPIDPDLVSLARVLER